MAQRVMLDAILQQFDGPLMAYDRTYRQLCSLLTGRSQMSRHCITTPMGGQAVSKISPIGRDIGFWAGVVGWWLASARDKLIAFGTGDAKLAGLFGEERSYGWNQLVWNFH